MKLLQVLILFLSLIFSGGHILAGDGTSFNPVPVTITSQGTIPVGTVIPWPATSFPPDASRWLECNGQAVPSGTQYDKLRALVGASIPNYDGQFLRGTSNTGLVGTIVADSIKSHTVFVPGQNAPVSGTLNSTGLSGNLNSTGLSGNLNSTALAGNLNSTGLSGNLNSTGLSGTSSPQDYVYQGNSGGETVLTWSSEYPNFGTTNVEHMTWVNGSTSGGSISGSLNSGSLTGSLNSGGMTGYLSSGSLTGWLNSGGLTGSLGSGALTGTAFIGNQTGSYSGGSETAPVHTRVRYLIRAVQ